MCLVLGLVLKSLNLRITDHSNLTQNPHHHYHQKSCDRIPSLSPIKIFYEEHFFNLLKGGVAVFNLHTISISTGTLLSWRKLALAIRRTTCEMPRISVCSQALAAVGHRQRCAIARSLALVTNGVNLSPSRTLGCGEPGTKEYRQVDT